MNTNTATEYRNLPLTESVDERNRDEVLAPTRPCTGSANIGREETYVPSFRYQPCERGSKPERV
jgi:hypothetical protein